MCMHNSASTCFGQNTKLERVITSSSKFSAWSLPPAPTAHPTAQNRLVLAAFGDTDNDGDIDMVGLVCENDGYTNSMCSASLKFYENTAGDTPGTPPSWQVRPANFAKGDLSLIVAPGYNYLSNNIPGFLFRGRDSPLTLQLVDYDGDNDLDIFLRPTKPDKGYYFENIGDVNGAQWKEKPIPSDFECDGYHHMCTFAFADMNNDGSMDAVRAKWSGEIDFLKNTQSTKMTVYATPVLISNEKKVTTVVLHDIDNDGDIDMLIGIFSYKLFYYENTGNSIDMEWTKHSHLDLPTYFGYSVSSYPEGKFPILPSQIVDFDLDGLDDFAGAVIEGQSQWCDPGNYKCGWFHVEFWKRTKIIGPTGFLKRPTWALSAVALPAGAVSPTGVDLNGDGHQDIVVGHHNNGLYYFERTHTSDSKVVQYAPKVLIKDSNDDVIKGPHSSDTFISNNRPVFMDVGQDGDFDLFLTTTSSTTFGIFYYENIGDSTHYSFVRRDSWVLQDKACIYIDEATGIRRKYGNYDYTRYCHIAIGHFDADNLLDLVATFSNLKDTTGGVSETLKYTAFRQTTVAGVDALLTMSVFDQELVADDANTRFNNNHKTNALPYLKGPAVFGDIDGDGDDDAIYQDDNALTYWERTANDPPVWEERSTNSLWSTAKYLGTKPVPSLIE